MRNKKQPNYKDFTKLKSYGKNFLKANINTKIYSYIKPNKGSRSRLDTLQNARGTKYWTSPNSSQIFKRSFDTPELPDKRISAWITPVFKKGENIQAANTHQWAWLKYRTNFSSTYFVATSTNTLTALRSSEITSTRS